MARRLATICRDINARSGELRIRATIEASWSSTDRHPGGVRWRIPGKGRSAHRLQVFYVPTGEKVLDHDSSRGSS